MESTNITITPRIFGIPYSTYDKFIDELCRLFKNDLFKHLPIEIVSYFKQADLLNKKADDETYRYELSKLEFLYYFARLESHILEIPTPKATTETLTKLIKECVKCVNK